MFAVDINALGLFAVQAGKLAFGLVILITAQVIFYRIKLLFLNRRKEELKKIWRPLINNSMCGEKVEAVRIKKRDLFFILEELNFVFSAIRGDEAQRLRKMCQSMGLSTRLIGLLNSRNIQKKLYALISLGNLHDHPSWPVIETYLSHKQITLSLAAARSLVQIDAARAVEAILPFILTRKDWPWANTAHILRMAGPVNVCRSLVETIQTIPSSMQPSFLRLIEVVQCEAIQPVTRTILAETSDDRVASVCLHISQDPGILPLAHQYIGHERWHVRMHAATALGRFGGEAEIPVLTGMLTDKEWWVRYRSAQALTHLPCMDAGRLQTIREAATDRYARDILEQVIKEEY